MKNWKKIKEFEKGHEYLHSELTLHLVAKTFDRTVEKVFSYDKYSVPKTEEDWKQAAIKLKLNDDIMWKETWKDTTRWGTVEYFKQHNIPIPPEFKEH